MILFYIYAFMKIIGDTAWYMGLEAHFAGLVCPCSSMEYN